MARAPRSNETSQRRIQSIEVGFQVVRAMEAAEGLLPLRDIAAAAGMPPSKAHLYLASFVREGVAYQDPATGHYGLGSFAIQLGLSAIRQLDVVELARPELISLREKTGLAVYLSLWGERGPGIVSKVDGERQGSLAVRLGYVLPLFGSATGRVFFAYLDERETSLVCAEEIAAAKETGEIIPDIIEMRKEILKDGYAVTANSINHSFAAVAAPVLGFDGHISAAITILGSDKVLSGNNRKNSIKELQEACIRLSGKLGYIKRDEAKETD